MSAQSNQEIYVGYSLIDITPTGVTRSTNTDDIRRDQQRNWETVLRCISLRTQPLNIQYPRVIEASLDTLEFGEFYQGFQRIWVWSWTIEARGVYDTADRPMGILNSDFEQVPIILGLTETARFMIPIFHPYGSIKNIYFKHVLFSNN
jgi:hypothetical protein